MRDELDQLLHGRITKDVSEERHLGGIVDAGEPDESFYSDAVLGIVGQAGGLESILGVVLVVGIGGKITEQMKSVMEGLVTECTKETVGGVEHGYGNDQLLADDEAMTERQSWHASDLDRKGIRIVGKGKSMTSISISNKYSDVQKTTQQCKPNLNSTHNRDRAGRILQTDVPKRGYIGRVDALLLGIFFLFVVQHFRSQHVEAIGGEGRARVIAAPELGTRNPTDAIVQAMGRTGNGIANVQFGVDGNDFDVVADSFYGTFERQHVARERLRARRGIVRILFARRQVPSHVDPADEIVVGGALGNERALLLLVGVIQYFNDDRTLGLALGDREALTAGAGGKPMIGITGSSGGARGIVLGLFGRPGKRLLVIGAIRPCFRTSGGHWRLALPLDDDGGDALGHDLGVGGVFTGHG